MENTFIDAFRTYLITEKRAAHNTVEAYMIDTQQLCEFFDDQEKEILKHSKQDLIAFLRVMRSKEYSSHTLNRKIASLKLFGLFLHERYNITNHAQSLACPKVDQLLPLYLTPDEVNLLLEHASNQAHNEKGKRNFLIITLLYAAGLRISELLSLTPDSFNFDTGFVLIQGKGNKQRSIPLPGHVLAQTKDFILATKPKNYLFELKSTGKPISRQQGWLILKKLVAAAGITKEVSPHSLRHSLATHLLAHGANLRSLQLLMGHESIDTIQMYTHVERSGLRSLYDKAHPRGKR